MTSERFDPRRFLIRLRGQEYLEVKWRLVWFRTEHPDASIVTELIEHSGDHAIVRASIRVPQGGEATGFAMERANDFPDYLEKAETKAIGRALAALGYGTAFAIDFGDPLPVQDAGQDSSLRGPAEVERRPSMLERGERILQRMREREREQGIPVAAQLEFLVDKGYLGVYLAKRLRAKQANGKELVAALGALTDEQLLALAAYCDQYASNSR